MHNPPKQRLRDLTMSPTMQGPHSSVKMPQLQPQRGSLPGNMQPHTSISMYSHGNYALTSCFKVISRIIVLFFIFATIIFLYRYIHLLSYLHVSKFIHNET